MPQTESNPIALGSPAPDFSLPDGHGKLHRLADFAGSPALLVTFISNRCPFVVHLRDSLAAFARELETRGLKVVAINSNDDATYPDENPAALAATAAKVGFGFPYLKDADQSVAHAYSAACTPEFYLYDADRRLAYHGQYDASRPKNGEPVTGADLRAAVEAVLSGQHPAGRQVPSIGCNIKWQAGNEPVPASTAA